MENTYSAADRDAVRILRALYMETENGDILYDARQYLQDRARYERNAMLLTKRRDGVADSRRGN